MNYKVIDLFCGAGGMTLGMTDVRFGGGFESVWAIDNDAAAIDTYQENFGKHAACDDIEEWLQSDKPIPKADVVVGGPPCQGFSLLNKKREGDERRALWRPFMDVVNKSEASVFIIENVAQLINSPERVEIENMARNLGFDFAAQVLVAADYGTPQTRRRTFLVGWKTNYGVTLQFPPQATHEAKPSKHSNKMPWKTVAEVIKDLPRPVGTQVREIGAPLDLHFGRSPTEKSKQRYRAVPAGGNRFDLHQNAPEITPDCWKNKKSGSTDLFGRLWWDRPSVTIRTEFYKPEKGRYLHPDQHRPITHREAARLMGFPDDFKFTGSKIEIAKQIGNAVPPHLAGAVGQVVRDFLDHQIEISKAA